MYYKTVLFIYDGKKCYCVFNELAFKDFSYKQSQTVIYSSENLIKYIKLWLNNIDIDIINLSIDLIGIIDTLCNNDYYIIIDEKNKKLKNNKLKMNYDIFYDKFINNNNLWNGTDFIKNENETDNKDIIMKYLDDSKYKLNILESIIQEINEFHEFEKKNYYLKKKATQLCRIYKYKTDTYEKLKYNILVTKIIKLENKISNYELSKKKLIVYNISNNYLSFNFTYEKEDIYVDDEHDYYLLNQLEPIYKFDNLYGINICEDILKDMTKYIDLNLSNI
jgi:hypothetical protein